MHSLLLLLLMASPAHARLRPNGDADRDGLTNYEESSVYQTNPRRSNTDRDGDSDYTEVLYSSAPPTPPKASTTMETHSTGTTISITGPTPTTPTPTATDKTTTPRSCTAPIRWTPRLTDRPPYNPPVISAGTE